MDPTGSKVLLRLYPKVDESEAPLPRSWSNKDKYTYIGLSQSNLKVHYKGDGTVVTKLLLQLLLWLCDYIDYL